MNLKFAFLTIATVSALLLGSSSVAAPRQSATAAISAANAEFVQAFAKGDVKILGSQYTRNPIAFREGKPTARGLKEMEAMWKEDFTESGKTCKVETVEVQEAGDWAYENGKFWIFRADGSTEYAGNYILIWKFEDGQWKIHREIGTSDPSLAPASNMASIEKALRELENELDRAYIAADTGALEKLLADDYVFVGGDGKPKSKHEEIQQLKSGELKIKSSKLDDIKVRHYGDTAIVTARLTNSGSWKGEAFTGHERITDVFHKIDGRWRLVSSQFSSIQADEKK